ncbi:glycoside hydrolase family 2 protein [candidate division KSB1 bacterium]|nr:glycoside hydrolase family 2 protein [candidate division KSB1 bacterium]
MNKSQNQLFLNSWKCIDSPPGKGSANQLFASTLDDSSWLQIEAPEDVHRALIDSGRIPDPFVDRNEVQCRWMEEREWWFRCTFNGPDSNPEADERLVLIFDGIDTFATIWLNSRLLGSHRNMFSEAVFDVTEQLKTGEPNTLAVCIDPPLSHVKDCGEFSSWGPNPERVALRKAQFSFGWDWGPRLPGIGFWRPVRLVRQRQAALSGVHFFTLSLDSRSQQAVVGIRIESTAFAVRNDLRAEIDLFEPGRIPDQHPAAVHIELNLPGQDSDQIVAYAVVEQPQVWWTHDLGEPALYTLRTRLFAGEHRVDESLQQVGIRTIELDQSPDTDEPGTRFFRFVLNGVPIFAKGANWIPADSFVASIPDTRYERLLTQARDAHMNMLRIWGGGIYEHDIFYQLCDRLGILVWQDFMFACAMYPDHHADFVDQVRTEARYQVKRLRSHACLALWCGNNENQWIHDKEVWEKGGKEPVPGVLFYHQLLPEIVAELDGRTPYWPGSPYGGNDHNSMEDGDRHNWQVWHGDQPRRFGKKPRADQTPEGVSFLHYGEDHGRFISEFGMHASPVPETLRRVIPEDQLWHHSPSMDHHNKDFPKNKGDNLMQSVTGLPRDLDEYIDFSMIAQAEGVKYGIEHFRRRKPHCSGALFWQLNDCWPVLSWSVIDYYGFGKAGYYAVRRAFAPVLALFHRVEEGGMELWVVNDQREPVTGEWIVRHASFTGKLVWQESTKAAVDALTSHRIAAWPAERLQADSGHYLWVEEKSGLSPANRHFFVAIKDLQRPPARVEMRSERLEAERMRVHLRSSGYALNVHLQLPTEAVELSDNHIDLPNGCETAIDLSGPAFKLDSVEIGLAWR